MMKNAASVFLICVLLFLSCFPASAQTRNQLSKEQYPPLAARNDLKAFFVKDIRKSGELGITVAEIEKLEKDSIKSSMKKNNLSSKQKTWIWVGAGTAVAVTLLVLLTRKKNDQEERICFLPEGCSRN